MVGYISADIGQDLLWDKSNALNDPKIQLMISTTDSIFN